MQHKHPWMEYTQRRVDALTKPPRCDCVTQSRRSRGDYLKWVGGEQCTRPAAYRGVGTDGRVHHYCKQHAREFPTPMSKGSNKPRAGLEPI